MAMYLQAVLEAKHGGPSLRATIEGWRANDSFLRGDEGPPGAYDPHAFGGSIVYTSPAVMWADLREQIGGDAFWELVRPSPEVAPDTATREEDLAWIEATTGEQLTAFFDRWLTGATTPKDQAGSSSASTNSPTPPSLSHRSPGSFSQDFGTPGRPWRCRRGSISRS